MALIEHTISKCLESCESSKTSDRKRGIKDLAEHLSKPEAIKILNKNSDCDIVNWSNVFHASHRCLVAESERIRTEEGKGTQAAATSRANLKTLLGTTVLMVVKKAKIIKCDLLMNACFSIFEDKYLCSSYFTPYTSVLRNHVLSSRKYWPLINYDQWKELLQIFLKLLTDKSKSTGWFKKVLLESLELTVKYGCQQSHLSLEVKCVLLPFLEREFCNLNDANVEVALLSLTIQVCEEVAKESRTGVCHLGETLVQAIMKMYEIRSDDHNVTNSMILKVMLLQVKAHHPDGSKQGSSGAYAYDWEIWNRHLLGMYRIVMNSLQKYNKMTQHTSISPALLDLSVALCNQLFNNDTANYDVTLAVNETLSVSTQKKRKLSIDIEGILDELSLFCKDSSCWPWLSLISSLLCSYPQLFKDTHLVQLLDHLWKLQCTSKDLNVMGYVCNCSKSLFKVMESRKVKSPLWLKIWETSLRTVGLNQNESESHSLLQALIVSLIIPTTGLENLLKLFLSRSIRVSIHSLKTLSCLLSQVSLPECPTSCDLLPLQPWDQPQEAARMVLLDWLLPFSQDDGYSSFEPESLDLLAKLSVMLTLRIRDENELGVSNGNSYPLLSQTNFERDYMVSTFDSGLFINTIESTSCLENNSLVSQKTPTNLVDVKLQQKLFDLLIARFSQLDEVLNLADNNQATSQGHSNVNATMKSKFDLFLLIMDHLYLVTCVLSYMIVYGTVKVDSLGTCELFRPLDGCMESLGEFVEKTVKLSEDSSKLLPNIEHVKKLLFSLQKLYGAPLSEPVCMLLRQTTTVKMILPIVNLLSTECSPQIDDFTNDMETCDGNQSTSVSVAMNSSLGLMDDTQFSDFDQICMLCINVLTLYSCPTHCKGYCIKQHTVLQKLLKCFTDDEQFDYTKPATFIMIARSMWKVLGFSQLNKEKHVPLILQILQSLCRQWHKDAEASSYILCMLSGLLKHSTSCDKDERVSNIILIMPFVKKSFGPRFLVQLVGVFDTIVEVDKYAEWTRWKCGRNLHSILDDMPSEAAKDLKDENGRTAIIEELLVFLYSPFYEVRLTAIKVMAKLFTRRLSDFSWELTMFHRVCAVANALFFIEDGRWNTEVKIDECSNRTASVLHMLASVIGLSSQCSRLALLHLFYLIKRKNLNLDLVSKVIHLLPNATKTNSAHKFLLMNLPCLLEAWFGWEFSLQDFPFKLLGFTTLPLFLENCLGSILPIVFRKEKMDLCGTISSEVKKSVSDIVQIACPVILAQYLPFITNDGECSLAVKRQYDTLIDILGNETMERILSSKLAFILLELLRITQDTSLFESLLGLEFLLPCSKCPTISYKNFLSALENLQKASYTDMGLLVYAAMHRPSVIQQVLLQLRADICASMMLYQKLLSLHQYCAFCEVIASHLKKGELLDLAEFIVRDVSFALLYLIRDYQNDPVFADISHAACRYLKILYEHILPLHVKVVGSILPTIVGIVVPVTQIKGPLADSGLALLRLLLINQENMTEAIGQLPPFPETIVFQEIREIHTNAKYGSKVLDLQGEILHFLGSANKNVNFTDSGCMLEGLQFLRKQLSEKKDELQLLFKNLERIRGFSEDCAESVLHQLVWSLIRLASSSNSKVQLEAACCLGELGPADLSSLVLQPAENCLRLAERTTNSQEFLLASVAYLLVDCLIDADVNVVKAASEALYGILSSPKTEALFDCQIIDKQKISPFLSMKGVKKKTAVTKDSKKVISMLHRNELWCPDENVTHEEWITSLVSGLLLGFSDEDSFLRLLIPVANVKILCAETMLSVLFNVAVHYSEDVRELVSKQVSQFFANHSDLASSAELSQPSSSGGSCNVCLNKLSVQCMMNAVNFIHYQKTISKDDSVCLDLNNLHLARAAQFCSAYFSSIMYAELWCSEDARWNSKLSGGSSGSLVDQICEKTEADGKLLQTLLREAYKHIGDHDAIYGCGSSMLQSPETRVKYYEHVGMWNQALLNYDMKLCRFSCTSTTIGLVNALKNCGLLHLMGTFLGAIADDQKEHLLPAQLDCMWRLGQWGSVPIKTGPDFDWWRFCALKSVHDGDQTGVMKAVENGRRAVLTDLTLASLESCNSVYTRLVALQALQEIEDLSSGNELEAVLKKWNAQSAVPQSDFLLYESIVAQRSRMIESLISHVGEISSERVKFLSRSLFDMRLSIAKLAREEGKAEIAEHWLYSLFSMTSLSRNLLWKLKVEEAQLAWSRGKGLVDTNYNIIACQQLRSLLMELKSASNESDLHASVLSLYGTWMGESRSETPELIIEKYLKEALCILNKSSMSQNQTTKLKAHYCLARFADLECQRITAYINSKSFQIKESVMKKIRIDSKLEVNATNASIQGRSSNLDEQEIKNTRDERDQFVELALRHYFEALILGEQDENLSVFRLVSLWLQNRVLVLKLVKKYIANVQSHKFIVLLPQLAASVGDESTDELSNTVNCLFKRCAIEHPHHTIPLILALAHSYKDPSNPKGEAKFAKDVRVIAASRMLSELRKNSKVGQIIVEMEKLSVALISFAYLSIDEKTQNYTLPRGEQIRQLHDLEHIMVPILSLPVRSDGQYNNIIGIRSFERSFSVANGITKPKKILCLGTDGVQRPVLVKGRDDLRQDAVMQQVFAIMNTLLRRCKEAKRRKLIIRTYKVLPLTQKCGILEWCEGTCPLGVILDRLHTKYYPRDFTSLACRNKIANARNESNAQRLRVFLDVCKNFHPAFRFFFTETYPTPAQWFEHRLAYVHSVATNSMVGYILGLGDRHIQNILVDKTTAELVHIDFGVAFEQGHVLPTPETVPFRLTRNIEDGMGVSGIEGVFRRSCEKTMAVLHKNQDIILTILEVLLYDPLYVWTTNPKNRQRNSKAPENTGITENDSDFKETNKMAERALSRLKLKLLGTEEGSASSVEGQVNHLIQQARDPSNLSRLYCGWQAYF